MIKNIDNKKKQYIILTKPVDNKMTKVGRSKMKKGEEDTEINVSIKKSTIKYDKSFIDRIEAKREELIFTVVKRIFLEKF